MTLGISVGLAGLGPDDAATPPQPTTGTASFWQVLAEGDATAVTSDENTSGWQSDAPFTELPFEGSVVITVDPPALVSAGLVPAAHQVAPMVSPQEAATNSFGANYQPSGGRGGLASIPTDAGPFTIAPTESSAPGTAVVSGGASVGAESATLPAAAQAKTVAAASDAAAALPSALETDVPQQSASKALASAIPFVGQAQQQPFADSVVSEQTSPQATPETGNDQSQIAPSPGPKLTAAPLAISRQSAKPPLTALKSSSADRTTDQYVASTTVAQNDASPAATVLQHSPAESVWRAKWGVPEPDVQAITASDAASQTVTPEASPARPNGSALLAGVTIGPVQVLIGALDAKPAPASEPNNALVAPSPRVTPNLIAAATLPAAVPEATVDLAQPFETGSGQTPPTIANYIPPIATPLTPVSASPPAIATNLTPIIVEMSKTGADGPVDIALAPEELGRLTISIRQEGDFVRVSMLAERPETLDLLRRHAGDLLADLRQSGFSGASFSFGQSGQDPAPQFAGAPADADERAPQQFVSADPKPSPSSRSHQGAGLDLRL